MDASRHFLSKGEEMKVGEIDEQTETGWERMGETKRDRDIQRD